MRSLRLLVVFVVGFLLLIFSGCIPPFSLNPIYTDKDREFDPDLLGSWKSQHGGYWEIKKAEDGSYDITVGPTDKEQYFIGKLVKIQDTMYMDVYPDLKTERERNGEANVLLTPSHVFLKVIKAESELQLDGIDQMWLDDYIKANPDALKCVKIVVVWRDNEPDLPWILTGSTEELRKFIAEIEDNKDAYKDMDFTLQRK